MLDRKPVNGVARYGLSIACRIFFVVALIMEPAIMEGHENSTESADSREQIPNWLVGQTDSRALEWSQKETERTAKHFESDRRFSQYLDMARRIAFDSSRIIGADETSAGVYKGYLYDVWTDAQHPYGVLRRTPIKEFRDGKPKWDVVLDGDLLPPVKGRRQYLLFAPHLCYQSRCMLVLLDGGAVESSAWREFDLETRSFARDGFEISGDFTTDTGGASVAWIDQDTLLVGANFGVGTLSESGKRPLVIRRWKRGTPLASAPIVFSGTKESDYGALAQRRSDGHGTNLNYIVVQRNDRSFLYLMLGEDGKTKRMTLPASNLINVYQGNVIFLLHREWSLAGATWKSGSLLSIPMGHISDEHPPVDVLLQPTSERETISDFQITRDAVVVTTYENVRARLWKVSRQHGAWERAVIPLPDNGTIKRAFVPSPTDSKMYLTFEAFLQPKTLYELDVERGTALEVSRRNSLFGDTRYVVEQFSATSRDGTTVPYFIVRAKDLRFSGNTPTLIRAYGANGNSQYPWYDGYVGRLWLDEGGVYVLANVRGGGEFGESWHVTAARRSHTYEDLVAVAEDLVAREVTSAGNMGLIGASAGGLLMGVMITQHPHMFGAAILEVPILDQFLPYKGASRKIVEYGSPDANHEVRELFERTSPLQNLRATDGFPVPFIATSTTDDDVPPAQARRFAYKMQSLGMPFFFYETPEGAHAIAATLEERARLEALEFLYLRERLMDVPARDTCVQPTSRR